MVYSKRLLLADPSLFLNYQSLSTYLNKEGLPLDFSDMELRKQLANISNSRMGTPLSNRDIKVPSNSSDWELLESLLITANENTFEDIPEEDIIAIGDKPNVVELLSLYPNINDIPLEVKQLAEKYHFYKVEFFTKLLPKRGHQIKSFSIRCLLSPRERIKNRPAAYDIFPDTIWKTILGVEIDTSLDVGIGFNHEYVAKLDLGEFKTKANVTFGGKILGKPISYYWRIALVGSGGKGSTCVDWRFRHKALLGDVVVMLIMKIPKSVKSAIATLSGSAIVQTGKIRKTTFPYRIPPVDYALLPEE